MTRRNIIKNVVVAATTVGAFSAGARLGANVSEQVETTRHSLITAANAFQSAIEKSQNAVLAYQEAANTAQSTARAFSDSVTETATKEMLSVAGSKAADSCQELVTKISAATTAATQQVSSAETALIAHRNATSELGSILRLVPVLIIAASFGIAGFYLAKNYVAPLFLKLLDHLKTDEDRLIDSENRVLRKVKIHLKHHANGASRVYDGSDFKPENNTPSDFVCPITQRIIWEPVRLPDGHFYEKEAAAKWYEYGGRQCPLNRSELITANPYSMEIDRAHREHIISYMAGRPQQSEPLEFNAPSCLIL